MLSPTQRAMIAALLHGQPKPVPTAHLVDVVYGDRDDGGPDNAEHIVRVQIYQIRTKLAHLGIKIETVGGCNRWSIGYRIPPEHCGALDTMLAESA